MAGLDANRGAKRAREARRDLGLPLTAPLPCLLDVVEERAGLPVVVAVLPEDLAGACVPVGDRRLAWVNGAQPAVRQRFTLAHELGHVWCKHDGRLPVDSFATLSGRTSNPLEVQANAFAAEFLIPRGALDEVLDREPTLDEIVVVAAHFGTSAIMTLYRFKQHDRISAARCARIEDEIRQGLHAAASRRLELAPLADRLGRFEHLPYFSPALAGTRLAAVVRGEAEADPALAAAMSRLLS